MSDDVVNRLNAALAGRYSIAGEIGRGGAATVYLAEDIKHGRKVALKVIRPEYAAACGAERFQREIAVAARLSHPHILPLYDSAEVDGVVFYTMPYVGGGSLRQRLDAEKRLPVDAAVRLTCLVASALDYAHAQGLVHRDIKPENILLYEGTAMVADFGIAVALGERGSTRLTEVGLVIGTAAYMSPEQAGAEESLDARSDLYSLACVLHEMLTGEPPHRGATSMLAMASRLHAEASPPSRLRPDLPAAVEQVLMRALARAPERRFARAGEFAAALEAALVEPTRRAPRRRPVAVLPFVNIGGDPEDAFFADGISEDVIAHLTKVRDLEVISRTSAAQFRGHQLSLREVGARLNVATLLEGSIRRAAGRVRIVAQLVEVETEKHLWAETYDRDLTDIFAIQTDVALQIAAALRAELSVTERARIRREPTRDLAAYEIFLRARRLVVRFTPAALREAAHLFESAVELDPRFALGHAGIAAAYTELTEFGAVPSDQAIPKARAAVARALELDPELAEGHSALAYLRFVAEFDFVRAEEAFERALALSPGSADTHDRFGRMLSSLGRFDEAHAHIVRARELDPLSAPVDLPTLLLRMGRYEEAVPLCRAHLTAVPDSARGRATLGWALILSGAAAEGITELEHAARVAPDEAGWTAQLGQAYARVGRPQDARAIQSRLADLASRQYVSPYLHAYVHVGLGELDRAMDWLERAYAERTGSLYGIKTSFLLAPLRSEPRFQALLKKLNLA